MSTTLFIVLAFGLLTIAVIFYSSKTATDLNELNSQINLRSLNKFEYVWHSPNIVDTFHNAL